MSWIPSIWTPSIWTRRRVLGSLSRSALVLPFADVLAMAIPPDARAQQAPSAGPASPIAGTPLGISFIDVAQQSGLNAKTIYGGVGKNKYLLETTGCGVAFYDYDADGWIDIFLVNGWRLEGFAKNEEPTCHLFKNNRDGTFTDVTEESGLSRSGWRLY